MATLATLPAPPATTRTVVLSSLASFQSQIDAAPNGSRIVFPAGSAISGQLRLFNRFDLDIDMSGCIHRTDGALEPATHWSLYHSERIRIAVGSLEGSSPTPGKLLYGTSDQAHGVNVFECRDIDVVGGVMSKLYGDPISIAGEAYWSQRIRMSLVHVLSAGRSGFSVLAGEDVTIEDNTIDMVGLHAFNVEPWQAAGGARRLAVLSNQVGSYGNAGDADPSNEGRWGLFLAMEGIGPNTVEDVTIDGNTVTGKSLQSRATLWPKQRIQFTNNTGRTDPPYYGNPAVLVFDKIDGLTVYGNGPVAPSLAVGSSTNVSTTSVPVPPPPPVVSPDTAKLATAKGKATEIIAIPGTAKSLATAKAKAREIVAL